LIASTFGQLDPKKQLREAGYPFDHIGTELMNLHGKFEVVSADVRVMKQEFQERTGELASTIERETHTLSERLEDARKSVLDRVEALFDKKFYRVIGVIIGAVPIMYGGVVFLQQSLSGVAVAYVAVLAGVVVLIVTAIVSGRSDRDV
jgi:VIT1/CCC1 family predicted Fe2+/Mn2+ transporter